MFTTQHSDRPSRIDAPQLLAVLALMLISVAFVFSATMDNESSALAWYRHTYFKQIIWFGLGLCAAAAMCMADYHTLSRWSFVAYWITIIALVAVIIPWIGTMRNYARRWIDLGPFQFQPSEFAKLAFILA